MALTDVEAAWRVIGVLFYVVSAFLAATFLGARLPWKPAAVQRFSRRIEAPLARIGPRHAIGFSAATVAVFLVLQWLTLTNPAVVKSTFYFDLWPYWKPTAETVLAGGNPYHTFDGGPHTWANSVNYGLVYPLLLAGGMKVAGVYGIIVLHALFAGLVPVLVYLLARDALASPVLRGYALLFALFIPQALFYQVRGVQDEPMSVVAILAAVLLLRRERLYVAAVVVGVLGAIKYVPLLVFAGLLTIHIQGTGRRFPEALRPVNLLPHATAFLLATGIFGTFTALGAAWYGEDYLTRTFGMTSLASPNFVGPTVLHNVWVHPPMALMGKLFLGAVALLYVAWLVAPGAKPEPTTPGYLKGVLAVLVLFYVLFPVVNPDHVTFAVAPGLIVLLHRWEGLAAPGLFDALLNPGLLIAFSVAADAFLWTSAFGGISGMNPRAPVAVLYTLVVLLIAVVAFQPSPSERRRERAATREPAN